MKQQADRKRKRDAELLEKQRRVVSVQVIRDTVVKYLKKQDAGKFVFPKVASDKMQENASELVKLVAGTAVYVVLYDLFAYKVEGIRKASQQMAMFRSVCPNVLDEDVVDSIVDVVCRHKNISKRIEVPKMVD